MKTNVINFELAQLRARFNIIAIACADIADERDELAEKLAAIQAILEDE